MIPHSCSTSSTSAVSGGLQHILTLELAVPDLHDAILQSGKRGFRFVADDRTRILTSGSRKVEFKGHRDQGNQCGCRFGIL